MQLATRNSQTQIMYQIRKATQADIPFLVETIIQAEKSGTDKLGLATLFELSEDEVRTNLTDMLEEEMEGCEFSVSSFLLAESDGQPTAATAGWIEAYDGENDSATLRANLILFTISAAARAAIQRNGKHIENLNFDREPQTLQIEYVYVAPAHRGQQLAGKLIAAHIEAAQAVFPAIKKAQVQLFGNNEKAENAYRKMGFITQQTNAIEVSAILDFLPHHEKKLMELTINNNMTNTLTQLKKVIATELKLNAEELDENTEISNIAGWDSMTHITIITAIEELFDLKFKLRELNRITNILSIVELVEKKQS